MESESQENHKNHIYIYINVTWRIVLYFLYYIDRVSYTGFPVAQVVKNLPAMQQTQVQSLGREDPLEKEMVGYPL